MFDRLEDSEKYGLAAGFGLALVAAFFAGSVSAGGSPTGAFMGGNADSADVEQTVQSVMDRQLQRQRQQLSMVANQSANITEDDLSIDATVNEVSSSKFGSLQKATVSVTGTVPSRTGGLRSLEQEQVFYVSQNGRYLFQEPTDLQQTGQRTPTPP
jgi:hypothetical protein